jgi:hypothetical protein
VRVESNQSVALIDSIDSIHSFSDVASESNESNESPGSLPAADSSKLIALLYLYPCCAQALYVLYLISQYSSTFSTTVASSALVVVVYAIQTFLVEHVWKGEYYTHRRTYHVQSVS